jgi:hypothetical protein
VLTAVTVAVPEGTTPALRMAGWEKQIRETPAAGPALPMLTTGVPLAQPMLPSTFSNTHPLAPPLMVIHSPPGGAEEGYPFQMTSRKVTGSGTTRRRR